MIHSINISNTIQSTQAEDLMTMRRRPVAQSTDCVRTKQGYARGLHAFEVTVLSQPTFLSNLISESNLIKSLSNLIACR